MLGIGISVFILVERMSSLEAFRSGGWREDEYRAVTAAAFPWLEWQPAIG
jgi:hypothetical protein